MRIAVLGWGSLISDPLDLKRQGPFLLGGPAIPIEFCRISSDGRLTLVISELQGAPFLTYFTWSSLPDLDAAVADLWNRENRYRTSFSGDPKTQSVVGFVDLQADFASEIATKRHPQVVKLIRAWAEAQGVDCVLWTALGPRFKDAIGVPFSVGAALNYLGSLDDEKLQQALEYIRQAPLEVITPVRSAVMQRWPA